MERTEACREQYRIKQLSTQTHHICRHHDGENLSNFIHKCKVKSCMAMVRDNKISICLDCARAAGKCQVCRKEIKSQQTTSQQKHSKSKSSKKTTRSNQQSESKPATSQRKPHRKTKKAKHPT